MVDPPSERSRTRLGDEEGDDEADAKLARRIRKGDERAFVTLFRAYHHPLCAFATRIVGRPTEAEDLVIDVFARIWETRTELEVRRSLKAYLFAAVRNRAIGVLRHRAVVDEVRDAAAAEGSRPGLGEPPASPSARAEARELELRIRRAIEELPQRCREAFVHHRWDGLTYREIAEVMGVSVRTVENQIARALELLRKAIRDPE